METTIQQPSTWTHKLKKWLKPPRRIKATVFGKFVLIFTVVLGVAAVNTGNNLLYLILGSMFGLIAASGILSEQSMKMLQVKRSESNGSFAGQAGSVTVELHNLKRHQSAYLIEVVDTHLPVKDSPIFAVVKGSDFKAQKVNYQFNEPGVFQLSAVEIRTRYPFDFYRRSYDVEAPLQIHVAAPPIQHGPAPLIEESQSGAKGNQTPEFDTIRPWVNGDQPNRIHWARSAALGELYVRTGKTAGQDDIVLDATDLKSTEDWENLSYWAQQYKNKSKTFGVLFESRYIAVHNDIDWNAFLVESAKAFA